MGWKHLADDVKMHGESNAVTALVWRLGEGEDPDDYYSSVPYEKVRFLKTTVLDEMRCLLLLL